MELSLLDLFGPPVAPLPIADEDDVAAFAFAGVADHPMDVEVAGAMLALEGAQDNEAGDLDVVLALAAPRAAPVRTYRLRSWEQLAHARDCKRVKMAMRQEAQLRVVAQQRAAETVMVLAEFPMLARQMGIRAPTVGNLTPERGAMIVRLACLPAFRGKVACRNNQKRALAIVADVMGDEQKTFTDRFLRESSPDDFCNLKLSAGSAGEEEPPMRIVVVNWEWDETSQRLRPLRVKSLKGERQPQHQVSVQMMVQQGSLAVYLYQRSDWVVPPRSPYFVKGLLLQKQNADFLLQAILQSFPFDLLDVSLINDLASAQEAFIINLCCDRASPNILLAKTMFKILSSPAVDRSILGHLEPCGAHGVALVKARAATCLTKNWRFMEELRSTTIRIVETSLKVKRAPTCRSCGGLQRYGGSTVRHRVGRVVVQGEQVWAF